MAEAGLSVRALAAATKEADPKGCGVAAATIGRVTTGQTTGRDAIKDDAAKLIAAALHKPVHSLFADDAPSAPATSTVHRRTRIEVPGVEGMLTASELASVIKKTPWWIREMTKAHPEGSAAPFPVHYAGKTPRYFLSQVLAWMDAVRDLVAAA